MAAPSATPTATSRRATVAVDGPGSKWTNSGYLYVGYYGYGGDATLNITNGGAVSNTYGYIGAGGAAANTVTVDGAGSKWTNTFSLYVGRSGGTGTLNIANGGAVSNTSGCVGYDSGSTGMVTISGAGSTWTNNGSLYVGSQGTGTVTQTGGTNTVAGALYLGRYSTGSGTYALNGGVLVLSALSGGSGTAAFNFGGGTLRANAAFSSTLPMALTGTGGNANIDTADYAVTLSGQLAGPAGLNKLGAGTLTLSGANTYNGLTTVNAGVLDLVDSTFNVSAGTASGTFAPLLAGGADIQAGKLVLDYTGGSDPVAAIKADLASGLIHSSTTTVKCCLGWADNTTNDQVTVMYTIDGDADLNGTVNGVDLNTVLSNYNKTNMDWCQGDFDGNGVVNGVDLNTVLSNYNQHLSSSVMAVPEPGALVLLLMAGLSLAAYGRRKRK